MGLDAMIFVFRRLSFKPTFSLSSFTFIEKLFSSSSLSAVSVVSSAYLVKAMVSPVVMCGCESWTIRKAEHWRINAFELWCWRRLFRVPWTARSSNQSILKETSPEYSLEGLLLKLKLQYFGHLMWRTDLLGKNLMLGKIEGRRKRGRQRMRWLDGITNSMDMSLSKLVDGEGQESLVCYSPWGCKELDTTERLNWTEWMRRLLCQALGLHGRRECPGTRWDQVSVTFYLVTLIYCFIKVILGELLVSPPRPKGRSLAAEATHPI